MGRFVSLVAATLALIPCAAAAVDAPFPGPVSPFPLTDDARVARVRYAPAGSQEWLLQQRVLIYREDAEIRSQQRLTTTASKEAGKQWRFEARGITLAADGYGKTLPPELLATDLTLDYVTDARGAIQDLEVEGGNAQLDVAQRALRAVQSPHHVPRKLAPGEGWTHDEQLDLDLDVPPDRAERGLVGLRLVADVRGAFTFEGWSEVGGERTLRIASAATVDGLLLATFDDGDRHSQALAVDVRGVSHLDEGANPHYQALDLRMVMADRRDVNARIHVKQVLADAVLAGAPGVCPEAHLLNEDGSCGSWRTPFRTRMPRRGESIAGLAERYAVVFGGLSPAQAEAFDQRLDPFFERYRAAATDEEREALAADYPVPPPAQGVEVVDLHTGDVARVLLPSPTHHYDLIPRDGTRFAVVGSTEGHRAPGPHYAAIHDVATGEWSALPDLPVTSTGCAGLSLDDGRLHAACASDGDPVGWILEDGEWQESPVDERLRHGRQPDAAWIPVELPWRYVGARGMTVDGERWLAIPESDGTRQFVPVLSDAICDHPGVDPVVITHGELVPLAEFCPGGQEEPAPAGHEPARTDVPDLPPDRSWFPTHLDGGVLFVADRPFMDDGVRWWPAGDDRVHPVTVQAGTPASPAEDEIRLAVIAAVHGHPEHVTVLASLTDGGSALLVTETEYAGWDFTRYNDSVSWTFDPAAITLTYRSFLDVGLKDFGRGPGGRWIALQEFDDDLAAHFAWSEAMGRWIRLPNTAQRGAAHYRSPPIQPLVAADGGIWTAWTAKPSRQWQAPFFEWEPLEQRAREVADGAGR